MLVLGAIVDQERLDRLEEQPCRIVEAPRSWSWPSRRLRRNSARTISAPAGADALQQAALKLSDQQCPSPGFQLPEKGSQLVGSRIALAGHCGTTRTLIQRF